MPTRTITRRTHIFVFRSPVFVYMRYAMPLLCICGINYSKYISHLSLCVCCTLYTLNNEKCMPCQCWFPTGNSHGSNLSELLAFYIHTQQYITLNKFNLCLIKVSFVYYGQSEWKMRSFLYCSVIDSVVPYKRRYFAKMLLILFIPIDRM